MHTHNTLGESLHHRGISQRGFLKFCAATAAVMALPPSMIPRIAGALEKAKRPSVIWLSFQECTGCTESLIRSHAPTLEGLILDTISLGYRRAFYERAQFAESFDDEGAKKGWCRYKLGCKGPVTHNACATIKWNQGFGA
jgi:hydrogenase small subunit